MGTTSGDSLVGSPTDYTGFRDNAFLHYGRRLGFPRVSRDADYSDPRVLGGRLEAASDALYDAIQNTAASKRVYMERGQRQANAQALRWVIEC